MPYILRWAPTADTELERLKGLPGEAGRVKQIKKALGNLSLNPRYPALQTHKFSGLPNPHNEKGEVFEAYAQQHTPGAARIIWCYGPKKNEITIIAIIAHP